MTRYNIMKISGVRLYSCRNDITSGWVGCGVPNRPYSRVKYVAEMCRTLNSSIHPYCIYVYTVRLSSSRHYTQRRRDDRQNVFTARDERIAEDTHEVHKKL